MSKKAQNSAGQHSEDVRGALVRSVQGIGNSVALVTAKSKTTVELHRTNQPTAKAYVVNASTGGGSEHVVPVRDQAHSDASVSVDVASGETLTVVGRVAQLGSAVVVAKYDSAKATAEKITRATKSQNGSGQHA